MTLRRVTVLNFDLQPWLADDYFNEITEGHLECVNYIGNYTYELDIRED